MKKHSVMWRVLALVVAFLAALTLTIAPVFADDEKCEDVDGVDGRVFFEFNSTDNDLGIHMFFDGPAWEEVEITCPDGTSFEVENDGSLKEIGSTELFTESAEPPLCAADECEPGELEAAIADFRARFPAGECEFEVETTTGDEIECTAELSHDLPDPLVITNAFDTTDGKIKWDTDDCDTIVAVFEVEDGEAGELVFLVDLPGDAEKVTVSQEFFDGIGDCEGAKAELICTNEEGNATITEEEVDCEDLPIPNG